MRDTYSVEDAIVVVVVETGFPPDTIEEYTSGPENLEELELVLEVEREEREVEVEVEPEDAVVETGLPPDTIEVYTSGPENLEEPELVLEVEREVEREVEPEDVVSFGEGAGVSLGAT